MSLSKVSYPLKNNVLKNYLEELRQIGLIHQEIPGIETINNTFDVFNLLENTFVIRLDSLPNDLKAMYSVLFDQMESLDSTLKVEDFQLDFYEKEEYGFKNNFAKITFTCQGETYIHKDYYELSDGSKYPIVGIVHEFYKAFNRVFIHQDSPLRIVPGSYIAPKIGFMLIDQKQYEFLEKAEDRVDFGYFDPYWYKIQVPNYYNPFLLLKKTQIEEYFNQLDFLGLFAHLEEIKKKNG